MKNTRWLTIGVALVTMSLASCGGGGETEDGSDVPVPLDDGREVLHFDDPHGLRHAEIQLEDAAYLGHSLGD